MQKKWLLDFEVKQALKISKARSPQRNKNQEKEGGEGLAQERALTDEDRANVRSYSVLMPLASRSVRKLDELLVKAVTEDSRSTGIGSYGGHIARERKLPGPLNGKEVYEQGNGYVTSPFYVKLKKKKVRAAIEDPDELNPAWDKNFVNDHQGREKAAKSEKDDQYLHLKLEMHSFLTRQCANPDVTPVSFPAAELSAPDRRGFPKLLPEEVLDEWTDMLAELSKIASAVASSDLMEIASWQKPPSAAVDILGFLAALLGVNPDWSTMKKVLLRNIPALLNFIQRIEPRQMPLQRILSAADWREEHIPVLSHIGIAKVNQALAKLTRWVLQFNRMITFYVCATEEDLESASLSIFTIVNERKIKKRRKKDSEKLLKGSGSKKMLHRGNSKIDIVRSESKRNLNRVGSKQAIQHSESVKDMRPANFINVDRESVNMHELITRNASTSFSKDHEECGSALTEIDFVSAAKEYEQSESSKSPLRDPILGRRRVSVVSQIIQKDKRKLSNKSTEEKGQESSDAFGVDVPELEERLAAFPKSAAPVHTEPNFEAQFWKSIGAAFMLDDKGQIILSNGKDIALYQDMLLGDETVTSDYSKQKLSGSDLALTTRRRKIVAANRDLIHNYVGLLIRQASNEYASSTTKKG